jgi:hypothetical protein
VEVEAGQRAFLGEAEKALLDLYYLTPGIIDSSLVRALRLAPDHLDVEPLRSFAALAFQGGTALRFLCGLRRFSEDLGFALERPRHDRGLEHWARLVKRDFELSGYDVEATLRAARTVHAADVKLPGLLPGTGLSRQRGAKLMIRIEVDPRPPSGAAVLPRLVDRHQGCGALSGGPQRQAAARPRSGSQGIGTGRTAEDRSDRQPLDRDPVLKESGRAGPTQGRVGRRWRTAVPIRPGAPLQTPVGRAEAARIAGRLRGRTETRTGPGDRLEPGGILD